LLAVAVAVGAVVLEETVLEQEQEECYLDLLPYPQEARLLQLVVGAVQGSIVITTDIMDRLHLVADSRQLLVAVAVVLQVLVVLQGVEALLVVQLKTTVAQVLVFQVKEIMVLLGLLVTVALEAVVLVALDQVVVVEPVVLHEQTRSEQVVIFTMPEVVVVVGTIQLEVMVVTLERWQIKVVVVTE
jgi:hypothetical protein